MPDFLESPRFPGCPSFGFTSDPEYRVVITRRASGVENAQPRVGATRSPSSPSRSARAWRTRFRNCSSSGTRSAGRRSAFGSRTTPTSSRAMCSSIRPRADQPLVELPDESRRLPDGEALPVRRAHARPRRSTSRSTGTIVLSGGGTVDYTTGTVDGAGGTWGGEFDLPMRFDRGFPVEVANQRIEIGARLRCRKCASTGVGTG